MRVLSYLLRRHLVPFGFAFAALTSLILGYQMAEQAPGLRSTGVPGSVVFDVFLLSVPFIVAMTLPMAVLVAVLYGFTHLARDGPDGTGVLRLIAPVLVGAACVAALTFWWSDRILPRSNHRLRVLQLEIQRKETALPAAALFKGDREMTIAELRRVAWSARQQAARAAGREPRVERAARQRAAMYEVEIQKRYASAAACLVFALLGASVGLRLSGRGVGLVLGVSSIVLAMYFAGLNAGEKLGDRLVVSPFLAMWTPNLLFGIVGLALWRIPTAAR